MDVHDPGCNEAKAGGREIKRTAAEQHLPGRPLWNRSLGTEVRCQESTVAMLVCWLWPSMGGCCGILSSFCTPENSRKCGSRRDEFSLFRFEWKFRRDPFKWRENLKNIQDLILRTEYCLGELWNPSQIQKPILLIMTLYCCQTCHLNFHPKRPKPGPHHYHLMSSSIRPRN